MLDKDIREPLFDYLDERYGKVRTIEEKIIKKSRADVLAVIDGELLGFEIKSDSDTYTRLKTQIKDYDAFCDRCYLVVGEHHTQADKHIPEYWGIIIVNEENVIVERDADLSPKVKLYNQLDLLWRKELLNIQLKEGLPKLMSTRRRLIYDRLVEKCGEDKIRHDISEQLFERDYTIYDSPDTYNKYEKKSKRAQKNKKTVSKTNRKTNKRRNIEKEMAHVTNYVGKRRKK